MRITLSPKNISAISTPASSVAREIEATARLSVKHDPSLRGGIILSPNNLQRSSLGQEHKPVDASITASNTGGAKTDVGILSRNLRVGKTPFVCPKTCPKQLCDCAKKTKLGYPDAQDCAPQLHRVCTSGQLSKCVDNEYLPFYRQCYCAFAKCWLASNNYEDCTCLYHKNYCKLYSSYKNDYPKVAKKCSIDQCCRRARTSAKKAACIKQYR
mmetsp:Transcript_18210/g.38211  ORF Transcript_18210/g.38211 Transcript_18210/m.38211 type:complete len:213 (+) Transcript_18210:60-698(+)